MTSVIASKLAQLVPLDLLRDGEGGKIVEMDGPVDAVHRLQELGLRVGEPLQMLRQGPPHIVQLGGVRLGLRPEPSVLVLVGPDEE